MSIFNNKKPKLSEEQRLQVAQNELLLRQSAERLEKNLHGFMNEYVQIVKKYGIRHCARSAFDSVRGVHSVLAQEECREELDRLKEQAFSVKNIKDNIVKPDDGLIKMRPSA